jgi:ethanolamine utilization protein EutN
MILARVEGFVVATKKNAKMTGSKFLFVRPLLIDQASPRVFKEGTNTIVAVDNLGAGEGEVVLIVQGSSARLGAKDKDTPIDAIVIGIVDTVDVHKQIIYRGDNPQP